MTIQEKLDRIFEQNAERMGSFSIQTDHPGLMKSLKKRKTSKVDRSPFTKDEDARRQYITGTMDTGGKKRSKVEDNINKRLEND